MNWRRINSDLHRDVGCFLSGLVLVYCLSGVALNHVDDWNPGFIVEKRSVQLDRVYTAEEIDAGRIAELTALVGEDSPRLHDFPTPDRVKLYYDNATLLLDLPARSGAYERIRRRPLFYQANVLHRNSLKGWRWASDLFGVLLAFLTVSGWFMLRGRRSFARRGVWLVAAGMVPPVAAILLFEFLQR